MTNTKNPWRREERRLIKQEVLPWPKTSSHNPRYDEIVLAIHNGCQNNVQIGKALGIKLATVQDRVSRLIRSGLVRREDNVLELTPIAVDWCESQKFEEPTRVWLDCEVFRLAYMQAKEKNIE